MYWQNGWGLKTRLIGITDEPGFSLIHPSSPESTSDKSGVAATGGHFLFHFEHYTTQIVALCASEPIGEDPIAPPVGVRGWHT